MWTLRHIASLLPLCAIAALTVGCGGEDSPSPAAGNLSSAPASAPISSPAPSPPQAFATLPFALQQSAGYNYAVLGYRVAGRAGPFENIPDPETINATLQFGFAHVGSGAFSIAIGDLGSGALVPNGGGGIAHADGRTTQFGFNALGGSGSISEALDYQARPLAATAFGYLSISARPAAVFYADDYLFLYGVPAQPAAVPTTGTAEFRDCCESTYSAIEVDYATGKMTALRLGDQIAFIDVAIGSDRSTFGGKFTSKDGEGILEGRFTGADGRELMMRLIVPGKAAYLLAMRRI